MAIVSSSVGNSTAKPGTTLAAWTESTRPTPKGGTDDFLNNPAPNTSVLVTREYLTVRECAAKHPDCVGIYGFAPFKIVGQMPKVPEPAREGTSMSLASAGEQAYLSREAVALAHGATKVTVLWTLKRSEKTRGWQPKGVAIVTEKQFAFPGGGELALS